MLGRRKHVVVEMADAPEVSVIIPSFNRAQSVVRAIASVCRQRFQRWELIVVDDASTDDTEQVVKSVVDSRVRYVRTLRSSGPAAARNAGVRSARARIISFLDSDDEWGPEKLYCDHQALAACPSAGLAYTGEEICNQEGRILSVHVPAREGYIFSELVTRDCIGSCSRVTVRRDVLETVGGFDEALMSNEDWDLWLRISKLVKVICIPRVLIRRHLDGERISNSLRRVCESRTIVVDRYWDEMTSGARAKHSAELAMMWFNYDAAEARERAFRAIRSQWFQPRLFAAMAASYLGKDIYGRIFSIMTALFHREYIGRARI